MHGFSFIIMITFTFRNKAEPGRKFAGVDTGRSNFGFVHINHQRGNRPNVGSFTLHK